MENKNSTIKEYCKSRNIEFSTFQVALNVLFFDGYNRLDMNLSTEVVMLLDDCIENKLFKEWRKNGFKEDFLYKQLSANISNWIISLFVFDKIHDKQCVNAVFSAIRYSVKNNCDEYLNNTFLDIINSFSYTLESIKELRFKIFYAEQMYYFFNNMNYYYIPNRGSKYSLNKNQKFMDSFYDFIYYYLFIIEEDLDFKKTFDSIKYLVQERNIPFLNNDLLRLLNISVIDKNSAYRLFKKICILQHIHYLEFEVSQIDIEIKSYNKYKFVEVKNLPVEDEEQSIMRALEKGEGEKFGY